MAVARFRFHGELSQFLSRERRGVRFGYACARAATLKNAIEALGVPHTEAGVVLVNGRSATLPRIVREGDEVDIYPGPAPDPALPYEQTAFVADAHLGGLARFLRMLGFDTLHDNRIEDEHIRRLAVEERRIVLTRDRELLKCRDIAIGCYVHERKPEAQLREVAERYGLAARASPFTLCLVCNLELQPVAKTAVAGRLPAAVAARHERFMHCAGCDRVYWPGSHYARMREALGRLVDPPGL
jgi:uncharacterized protein with PIN domain